MLQDPRCGLGSEELAEDLQKSRVLVQVLWTFTIGPHIHRQKFERRRLSRRRQPEVDLMRQVAELSRLVNACLDRLIVQRACLLAGGNCSAHHTQDALSMTGRGWQMVGKEVRWSWCPHDRIAPGEDAPGLFLDLWVGEELVQPLEVIPDIHSAVAHPRTHRETGAALPILLDERDRGVVSRRGAS